MTLRSKTERRFGALALLLVPCLAMIAAADPEADEEARLVRLIRKVRPAVVAIGGGSGVIVSPDGWVLTNHHVAGDPEKVWTVRLPGGRLFDAKITGRDVVGDIALLKIDAPTPLPFLPLADSDAAEVGQAVLAGGNPWGFAGPRAEPTFSHGIISALHRYQNEYGDAIQTDAPINPGNSGGPLISMKGEVLGINGRIAFRFGERSNTGVGFAIPANQIKRFMPALKTAKGGRVDHGEIAGLVIEKSGEGRSGAAVQRVLPKTDAARLGLKEGDRIVAVGEVATTTGLRFLGVVSTWPEGTSLTLKVRRGDEALSVTVKLVKGKGGEGDDGDLLRPAPETPYLGFVPGMSTMNGVRIRGIWESSPADLAGLRPGDILVRFNRRIVRDGWELRSTISALSFGDLVQLEVEQSGQARTVSLTVGNSSHYPLTRLVTEEGLRKAARAEVRSRVGFTLEELDEGGQIRVAKVIKGGPAETAGLRSGDELLSVNGVELDELDAARETLARLRAGSEVRLELFREGRIVDLRFKLGD